MNEPHAPAVGPAAAEAGQDPATAHPTRIDRNEAAIAEWRGRVLSNLTPLRVWGFVALLFLLTVAVAVETTVAGAPAYVPILLLAAGSAVTLASLAHRRRKDAAIRAYASLTPVLDPKTMGGEIAVVLAASDTMLKTFANPNATTALRRLSVLGVMSSAQRIMDRGGVTPETASVAGYPAWPAVDRTEMPGNPGDFQTFHLLRIDASAKRMARVADETHGRSETLLQETFAAMAGELVPPARALLAEVSDPDEREPAA